MLHRNLRTEPLGSAVPKGPTPGEGSSRFCSGVPRGWQVKEERLGVCPHVGPEAVLGVTSGGRAVNPYSQSAQMLLSATGTLSLEPPPKF